MLWVSVFYVIITVTAAYIRGDFVAQYIYGKLITTGKIVAINEVPKDITERKGWECICPKCGIEITARRGDLREDHFAHKHQDISGYHELLCSAGAANETALHQMAKEILIDELDVGEAKLVVPAVEFFFREANIKNIPHYVLKDVPHKIEYRPSEVLPYTKATAEVWSSGIRPDIIIETPAGEYLIEIRVTHAVSMEKKKIAENRELPVLEIDLSEYAEASIGREDLRELILEGTAHKHWVVRPNSALVLEWGRKYYEGNTPIQQYLAEKAAKEEAQQRRKKLFQSENYAIELKQLEGKRVSELDKYSFYRYERTLPFFINIPICGEIIFKCDRRVWQGAIFDKFIYNRRPENRGVYVERIILWMKQHQDFFDVDWDLLKGSSLLREVLNTYLDYLMELGFLSNFTDWNMHYVVDKSHSLIPPNQEFAENFLSAIVSVDRYLVEIDDLLFIKMKPTRDRLEKEKREMARQKAELEEKRRAEEQAQRAREAAERAEAERAEKMDRAKQMILADDYGEELNSLLYDQQGYRLALCTACNNITRAQGMKYEPGNIFKGICGNCRRRKC